MLVVSGLTLSKKGWCSTWTVPWNQLGSFANTDAWAPPLLSRNTDTFGLVEASMLPRGDPLIYRKAVLMMWECGFA